MTNLNTILAQVKSPEPSDSLKARILLQATSRRQCEPVLKPSSPLAANDNHWKRWVGYAAMAIILGVIGVNTLAPVPTSEEEVWAETAQNMGYEDLYAWVEGEVVDAQTENQAFSPL